MDKILTYLKEKYQPDAIVVYGSFVDGSANENSDFDALVIGGKEKIHDSSVIDGTVLDVFVYPLDTFRSEYDPEEFVQVWDGKIVLDKDGAASRLQNRVLDHIASIPQRTVEEIEQEVAWCEKMLSRTMRDDAEGYYRWHLVLVDSLEIYFDIKGLYYYGPKKAMRFLEQKDPAAFRIYEKALREFKAEYLSEWVIYLRSIFCTVTLTRL